LEGLGSVSGPWPRAGFWRGRRVLVSGHTGFKGGWLTVWLKLLGAELWGFGLPSRDPRSLYLAARVGEGIEERFGDIRDRALVEATIAEAQAEVVFHLAAQPLVLASFERPADTYEVNVTGTVNLLEGCLRVPTVEAVVCVTSDKCYRPAAGRAHREQDPLGGADPYSTSKAAAELVVDGYRAARGAGGRPRLATARAGNVIGGGDWAPGRLLPDLMRAAASGEPLALRKPAAVRPWQHVLCPLLGYLLLAERLVDDPAFEGPWNFGPGQGDTVAVAEVVARVERLLGRKLARQGRPSAADQENPHLALDSGKAEALLGWRPPLDLGWGLQATVEWYGRQAAGEEMEAFTVRQLRAVEKAARSGCAGARGRG